MTTNERAEFLTSLERDFRRADKASRPIHTGRELRDIARGIYGGQIFCDRHCRTIQEFNNAFGFILSFGGSAIESVFDRFAEGQGLIFEYMSKASPTGINGIPFFMSLQVLTPVETRFVFKKIKQMEAVLNA